MKANIAILIFIIALIATACDEMTVVNTPGETVGDLSAEKAITSFIFAGMTSNVIAEIEEESISAVVPFGTDVSSLVAIFETSAGAEVMVGGIVQESGVNVNDFSSPVDYTVVAENGSENTYVVTVVTDEDFVGMWYHSFDSGSVLKVQLTANTYESAMDSGTGEYVPRYRGSASKIDTATIELQAFEKYVPDESTWHTEAEHLQYGIDLDWWTDEAGMISYYEEDLFAPAEYAYVVSIDGETLTLDGLDYSLIEP